MTTDTSRRLLRAALKRFEAAVRDQAQLVTADSKDWEAIEWEYTDAMRSLYSRLGLTAPRVRKDRSGKAVKAVREDAHSGTCATWSGGKCNCIFGGGHNPVQTVGKGIPG